MTWSVDTIEDTAAVAKELLAQLSPAPGATVLALHGDLGAGKTTFTQQLAQALGITEIVTSPTFVIMKGYETTSAVWSQLVHIDAYRIEDIDEMRVLGFERLRAQKDTIICIEWAERIASLLPDSTINLTFTQTGDTRQITQS